MQSNRNGSTQIGNVVSTNQVGLDCVPRCVVFCPPLHLDERRRFAHPALDIRKGIFPQDKFAALSHLQKVFVKGIEEDFLAAFVQVVIEFAFCLLHAFEAAKAFQMGSPDIRDEPEVCFDYTAKVCYLAWMIGACLDDGNIVLGLDAKQGERHADVIIEIALGIEDVLPLGKDSADEFFCGGLAVGSRNLQNSLSPCFAMIGSQFLQGRQHIRNEDESLVLLCDFRIIYDSKGTTFLESLQGIVVAVERFAFQGKENASFRTLAAVRRHQ